MPPQKQVPDFWRNTWAMDRMYVLSMFHAKEYRKHIPAVTLRHYDPILNVTRNGIDLKFLKETTKTVKKNMKRLLYTSRPERGMQELLTGIWPVLHKADPSLELALCTYDIAKDNLPTAVVDYY